MAGRPNKIRAGALEGVVRKLAADGLGYREIADELKKRGHDIAHATVGRFLVEESEERREAARNVASEIAHDTVPLVTGSLRRWVVDIGQLVKSTLSDIDSETDPDLKSRKLRESASSIASLVNAGTKAAKTLHDITIGDAPASHADDLRGEVLGILAARNKRVESEE
jgi:hypothetical protein